MRVKNTIEGSKSSSVIGQQVAALENRCSKVSRDLGHGGSFDPEIERSITYWSTSTVHNHGTSGLIMI